MAPEGEGPKLHGHVYSIYNATCFQDHVTCYSLILVAVGFGDIADDVRGWGCGPWAPLWPRGPTLVGLVTVDVP